MSAAGLTHASSVKPFVRSSAGASGTVTQLELPLNESAPPTLPAATQVVSRVVPALFCPVESRTVVPVPSSNAYDATRPLPAARGADDVLNASASAASTAPATTRALEELILTGSSPTRE